MRLPFFSIVAAAGLAAGAQASGNSYKYPQLMGYRSFLPELEETANFARMGIPLRTVFIANTVSANGRQYCQYPPVWKGMGDYDFAPVDAQLGDILKASPNAEFSIFLDLNTPDWLTRRVHHDSYNEITHALSSPVYMEEASNYLDKLVRYIEENYGDRVKSYSILCGYTSEWLERNLRQSHVKNLAWRRWCSERGLKYGLSTPTESDLATAAFEGTVYDPATEREKIDFWKFHSWIISEGVLHFSHIVKKVAPGKPVGADYGYYMICDKDPGGVGNLDYERVVTDPGFDCIISPATYSGREIGGGTGSMLVVGTCRRYGKRFYYSVDQWPHSLKNEYGSNYFKTMADTLAGNTRNAAFALVHHANFHWFDMWGGFYRDPEMKERISKIAAIQRRFADDDSAPAADVLIVADPDSAYGRIDPRMAANDELGPEKGARCPEGFVPAYGCGEEFRNRINHVGVVYDVVSFNDIPHIDMRPFKAVVLSDVWTISPEKEKVLLDHVLRDGRTIVWAYAPGVSDGKSVDAGRVRRWAGVDFKTPGVTTTPMGGWNAVYAYDYRLLTPEKFRKIFEAAGCHAWMDELVPVMANGRLLAIHVKDGGRKTVRLSRRCSKVVDLLAGRAVATDCDSFEDEFATPDTKIYETVYESAFRPTPTSMRKARDFVENQKSFRLGFLPTERANPITASLERDFKRSFIDGVECLQRADRQVPIAMRHVIASREYKLLVDAMETALKSEQGRIVFTGCGATGRLSMLLESMWRDFFSRRAGELDASERKLADRVFSIMTAGDFALIKSVEFFEDYWDGGARQTDALGVGPSDVIIALNGGGECSTILGSVLRGVERGATGFMNINNPKELLRRIERARRVIDDPRMTILDFYCGSMALAGSTRMQSTTTQQFIYCAALETALARIMPRFAKELPEDFVGVLEDVMASLESPGGRGGLAAAIEFEKGVYEVGGRITYLADDCMLDLFTDNTERSPTFMLPQLCSREEAKAVQSWAFVKNPLYATPDCWTRMLRREPRCLDGFSGEDARAFGMPQRVVDNPPKIGRADLMKYMIGNEPAPERINGFPRAVAVTFSVGDPDPEFSSAASKLAAAWPDRMAFQIGGTAHSNAAGIHIDAHMPPSPLETWKHIAVKLVINNLSTGTMAAMGRVAGNYMSWVSISNKKLTDRGCRLLRDLGHISYEEAAQRLFAAAEWIDSRDWLGKERPCAVQMALEELRKENP